MTHYPNRYCYCLAKNLVKCEIARADLISCWQLNSVTDQAVVLLFAMLKSVSDHLIGDRIKLKPVLYLQIAKKPHLLPEIMLLFMLSYLHF